MKKIYSFVLMAAALLIGTNAWADVTTRDQLQQAINNAGLKKDVGTVTITLGSDITIPENSYIWLGTNGVDDDIKSINLELNGFNIKMESTGTTTPRYMFVVSHGELLVTNQKAAKSQLILKGNTHKNSAIFYVYGSYKSSRWTTDANGDYVAQTDESKIINTRNEGYFSHVEIGEKVELYADGCNGTGIVIDAIQTGTAAYKYGPKVLQGKYLTDLYAGSYGLAQGVRVDIKGDIDFSNVTTSASEVKSYGIKLNGLVWNPLDTERKGLKTSFGTDAKYLSHFAANRASHTADTIDAPYIHIYPGAHIKSSAVTTGATDNSTAVYVAGYGKVRIDGAICEGNTALYASSGAVEVNDATLHSTATEYTTPDSGGSANGGGSTLVLNSRDSYGGGIDITITGDTKITSDAGYAIESRNNTSTDSTKVEGLHIESATIEGGDMGAIIIEPEDDNKSTIVVANITGQVSSTDPTQPVTLEDLVSGEHHTVVVDGVTVVTPGAAPAATDWATIEGNQGADKDYSWSVAEAAVIGDGTAATKVTLGNLEMNAGTSGNLQSITIKDKATLEANYIMMNDYARIIVEAGGTLIVKGANGIYSNKVENIVLETQEGKPAIFLFNPAVTFNTHPKATVEFTSKSYMKNGINVFQRFGIPSYTALESMTSNYPAVRTRVWEYSAASDSWVEFGDLGSFDIAQLNKPFAGYNSIAYTETANMVYTMKGSLVGNQDGQLDATLNWTTFANSYSANIEITEFLSALTGNMDATVYAYKVTNTTTQEYTWDAVNEVSLMFDPAVKIAPMQAFILHKIGQENGHSVINYNDAVYQPAISGASSAPRRRALANLDITKIGMTITAEQGACDKLYLVESNEFTTDYERGFDAEKYMNDDINVYANATEKQATLATNDLENTYIGFSTVNGGQFTISFANVEGREFDLIDLETGTRMTIADGFEYEFTAAANYANDYRFKVVERNDVPTAIDNTEAVKNAKGIYTITGQYMGEMNVWNTLPAGVYVVNGEKVVK